MELVRSETPGQVWDSLGRKYRGRRGIRLVGTTGLKPGAIERVRSPQGFASFRMRRDSKSHLNAQTPDGLLSPTPPADVLFIG